MNSASTAQRRLETALRAALICSALLLPFPVNSADHTAHMAANTTAKSGDKGAMWRSMLKRAPLSATGYFDDKSTLWVATVQDPLGNQGNLGVLLLGSQFIEFFLFKNLELKHPPDDQTKGEKDQARDHKDSDFKPIDRFPLHRMTIT